MVYLLAGGLAVSSTVRILRNSAERVKGFLMTLTEFNLPRRKTTSSVYPVMSMSWIAG